MWEKGGCTKGASALDVINGTTAVKEGADVNELIAIYTNYGAIA